MLQFGVMCKHRGQHRVARFQVVLRHIPCKGVQLTVIRPAHAPAVVHLYSMVIIYFVVGKYSGEQRKIITFKTYILRHLVAFRVSILSSQPCLQLQLIDSSRTGNVCRAYQFVVQKLVSPHRIVYPLPIRVFVKQVGFVNVCIVHLYTCFYLHFTRFAFVVSF